MMSNGIVEPTFRRKPNNTFNKRFDVPFPTNK